MAESTMQVANGNSHSLGQLVPGGATVGFLLWQTWHINRVQQSLFGNQLFTLISLVHVFGSFYGVKKFVLAPLGVFLQEMQCVCFRY